MNGEERALKKLDFIDDADISNQQVWAEFVNLLQDSDEEVRMNALEKIGITEAKEHVVHVVAALQDTDLLVRTTALEIIGDWKVLSEYERVIDALDDQENLVRYAAMDALGDLGDERAIPVLTPLLPILDDRGKVSCLWALAKLEVGNRDIWSQHLLDLITSSDYRTRCAVANSILDVWPREKFVQLLSRLKQAHAEEETVAARSSIEGAIEEIEELMQD